MKNADIMNDLEIIWNSTDRQSKLLIILFKPVKIDQKT